MIMFILTYMWNGIKLMEEIPVATPEKAEELFLRKMHGNYSDAELIQAGFRIVSIEQP